MKPLLTAKQAADLLAISSRKLWSLTASGEVPHLRLGRSVRYRPEDLERLVEALKKKGGRRA